MIDEKKKKLTKKKKNEKSTEKRKDLALFTRIFRQKGKT